jgi:hypothetical protein
MGYTVEKNGRFATSAEAKTENVRPGRCQRRKELGVGAECNRPVTLGLIGGLRGSSLAIKSWKR